jgi:phage shock protein PspC (stress-responsive transcriptional regulator)
MIQQWRDALERRGFEVCYRLGRRLNIPPRKIRMYFIYTSFVALGSPIIVYLILAFFLQIKDAVFRTQSDLEW